MNFIKKYWKRILMIILSLLFFAMCTRNCSKNNEIRELKNIYSNTDSIIEVYKDSIEEFNNNYNELKRENVSLNREIELYKNQINDLNNALNRKVIINIKKDNYEK